MNRAAMFTLVFTILTALVAGVACDSQWSGCKPGSYPENGVCVEGCPPGTTEQSDGICIPSNRDTTDGDLPDGDLPDGDTPDGDTPDGDTDGDADSDADSDADGDTPDGDTPGPARWPMWGYDAQRTGIAPYAGPRSIEKLEKLHEDGVVLGMPSTVPVIDGYGRAYIPVHQRIFLYAGDGRVLNDNIEMPDCPAPSSMVQRPSGGWVFICKNGNITTMAPGNSVPEIIGTIEDTAFGGIEADPLVGPDGAMYFVDASDHLYEVNTKGELVWAYHLLGLHGFRPALGHDGTIYLASSSELHALSSAPGHKLLWSIAVLNPVSRNVVVDADGNIYYLSNQQVFKVDKDGQELWASAFMGLGSLALSPDGGVYYARSGVTKFSKDGDVEWNVEFDAMDIVINMIVDKDGYLYFVTTFDKIVCVSPTGTIVFSERIEDSTISHANLSFGNDGLLWFTITIAASGGGGVGQLYRLEGPTE